MRPDYGDLWRPRFPDVARVDAAASCWPDRESGPGGPLLVISAGVIALQRIPLPAESPTVLQALMAPRQRLQARRSGPRDVIKSFTPRARARMTRRLAELDYSPFTEPGVLPATITLTYPGDWLAVAPDGPTVKAHFDALIKRWERAWPGCHLIWKLEFQGRGAPHFHLYAAIWPSLRAGEMRAVTQVRRREAAGDGLCFGPWLKATWADIVAADDESGEYRRHLAAGVRVDLAEGARAYDPRRVAAYFSKHGLYSAKDYQHEIPAEWQEPGNGPGRFWGVRGLDRVAVAVVLTDTEQLTIARTLRRYARSRRTRRRGERPTPLLREVRHGYRHRKVRRRVGRLRYGLGFVCVNDGPALAVVLARLSRE